MRNVRLTGRKILMLMLQAVIFFSCSMTYASALNVQYTVEEAGMSFSLPEQYYAVTRDTETGDLALGVLGVDREELLAYMEASEIYFDAFDGERTFELTITVSDNDVKDLNTLSDMEMVAAESAIRSGYEEMGLTVDNTETYEGTQARFIKTDMSQDADKEADGIYYTEYYTVYNNKAICICLVSYVGRMTKTFDGIIKNLVDSIVFDTDPAVDKTRAAETEASSEDETDGDSMEDEEDSQGADEGSGNAGTETTDRMPETVMAVLLVMAYIVVMLMVRYGIVRKALTIRGAVIGAVSSGIVPAGIFILYVIRDNDWYVEETVDVSAVIIILLGLVPAYMILRAGNRKAITACKKALTVLGRLAVKAGRRIAAGCIWLKGFAEKVMASLLKKIKKFFQKLKNHVDK